MTISFRSEAHRVRGIRNLTEVSRAATYAASLDEVLQLTVDRAVDLLSAEQSLLLVANDDGLLAVRSSHGVDAELARGLHGPLNEALIPRLAARLDAPAETFFGVPLVVAGVVKGVLVAIRPELSAATEDDEWLLSALADQAAVALEKTRVDQIGQFREQLIGIVSHDLRTPLSTVLLGAELLLRCEGLGEKETELARKITKSASLAARLIEQLLDLTRSRLGGGITIDPRQLDMTDICKQIIGETELTHPERPLRVELRGNLTGVWDRDRMYQLLANLVGNAVQHGAPRSSIELRVEGGPSEVVIEVSNRGAPIPAASLPFIFDAFRQGRPVHADHHNGHGLGLGLFIAQQIAAAHGGAIAVTSSESDGTMFRIHLPRDAAAWKATHGA